MSIKVSERAPDFTLLNQDREPVTLSEMLKERPVVLAFFPAAFSRICTKEMCTFRDDMSTFANLNATVFGISCDTFFTLKAWATEQKLGFPLLSDFNKEVITSYGVYNPDLYGMKGTPRRAVFLINRQGIVAYREVLDNVASEPDYEKLKEAVAAL